MTNSSDHTPVCGDALRGRPHQPAAASPHAKGPHALPAESDAEARGRWRRIGSLIGAIAEMEVQTLYEDECDAFDARRDEPQAGDPESGRAKATDADKAAIDARIRKMSALVIAAQRAMEMRDSYDAKTGGDAAGDHAERVRKARERREQYERELEAEYAAAAAERQACLESRTETEAGK